MAIVKFTAFVADVRGRLGDYVWSFCRGTHYKKAYNATPTNPSTYRRQQVRTFFKNLADYWYNLTDVQQDLWQNYASIHPKILRGYDAFIMLNLHLLTASHVDLVCIYTPPKFPSTPKFPMGFSVFPMSSTVNCISWSRPLTSCDYITCYFRLHASFCNIFSTYGLCPTVGYRPSQRFVGTVRSDVGFILHEHTWPAGARLFYKIRSIDTSGRRSPFSHAIRSYVMQENY